MNGQDAASAGSAEAAPSSRRWLLLLPLAVFIGLGGVFLALLNSGRDPGAMPSMFVGKPAPKLALPALEGINLPGLAQEDLLGKVTLVNFFASWCVPCRGEHPVLTELAKDKRLRLVGVNWKDRTADARKFLGDLGNPYAAIGVDGNGRAAIDWGVYGIPETFVIGADGVVRARIPGALNAESIRNFILPALAAPPIG